MTEGGTASLSKLMSEKLPLFGYDSTTVPDIDFCVKDASVVEADVISKYESFFYLATKISKTLGRGDPVRLFLLSIIYQLVVQRSIIDSTGKENLLKYAHGANLDNLGAKWGPRGVRLQATSATTTLRFSLSSPITAESPIPLGTLAQSSSGVQFATTAEGIILPGGLAIDLPAAAVVPGEAANGLIPGQVNQLVQWNSPFLVAVTNLTTTSGGADVEDDEHFRARIWMAPESFSCAGPYGAYEYWAASANPDIVDVSVWSDPAHAGQVYIYPLMAGGVMPTQAVLDQVYAVCNADRIRPLTDQVFVQAPLPVSTTGCVVKYWIKTSDGQFSTDIQSKVTQAFADYLVWQRTKIGRDINPSKCDQMLVAAGAKRTDISEASSTFEFTVVSPQSIAVLTNPTLTYMGLEEE
jgi:phage-related baseplate assembly protein